jgi:hypothetical protein
MGSCTTHPCCTCCCFIHCPPCRHDTVQAYPRTSHRPLLPLAAPPSILLPLAAPPAMQAFGMPPTGTSSECRTGEEGEEGEGEGWGSVQGTAVEGMASSPACCPWSTLRRPPPPSQALPTLPQHHCLAAGTLTPRRSGSPSGTILIRVRKEDGRGVVACMHAGVHACSRTLTHTCSHACTHARTLACFRVRRRVRHLLPRLGRLGRGFCPRPPAMHARTHLSMHACTHACFRAQASAASPPMAGAARPTCLPAPTSRLPRPATCPSRTPTGRVSAARVWGAQGAGMRQVHKGAAGGRERLHLTLCRPPSCPPQTFFGATASTSTT